MNIALWIVQGLLALLFLVAGLMKASKSKDEIKEKGGKQMSWVDDVSDSTIKLIGVLELLAAIGLILPQLTGILPWLTPLAAVGLVLTMIGAMIVNVRNRITIIKNIVLFLLAAFVAYGRFVLVPA
ncbi:MAG: DoxX family protein [Chloroflexi bacterium]|nr:DoxX family protein [Chloroflexota bacterium]